MSQRTFIVADPHMTGDDVAAWQTLLVRQFARWGIDYPLPADGDYGVATRSAGALVLRGLGISESAMAHGVTPELRIKVRHRKRTPVERARWIKRAPWRRRLRDKFNAKTASPITTILADSWGWHPGVHDGIDLICKPNATLYAMVEGDIVRADTGGWWGKNPSGDVAKGDGIIILRCTVDIGPFERGMNICYGHAEHPKVKPGDHVRAGAAIGQAGLAVAWHTHLMVNARGDTRGVGDRDPKPYVDYARQHAA